MTYRVKEIFYTLQGEGMRAGRPAVFCRFTSCNLWTGRERDRHRAICQFCDTDFVGTDGPGGGVFQTAADLAAAVAACWAFGSRPDGPPLPGPRPSESRQPAPAAAGRKYVVCTGGEPLLQLDSDAVNELHAQDFEVAIETNGTRAAPGGINWICVSPKAGTTLVLRAGDELKLVYPQPGAEPERFEELPFGEFLLQPMDGPDVAANTAAAVQYCLQHPRWRLSLQTHKFLGIR